MKKTLFNLSMWWAVVGAAIWVGGTVFMFSVVNPQWSHDPPDSVRQFFLQTHFNEYIGNFFGPPFMAFRSFIPQLLALILSWKMERLRPHLLIALGCTVVTITFTLIYIYPINNVLMTHAGIDLDNKRVLLLTKRWLIADRIRFLIGFVGFVKLLKAFRTSV
jgi:hypothetical protein